MARRRVFGSGSFRSGSNIGSSRSRAVVSGALPTGIRRSALRVYIDSLAFAASIDRRCGPFSLHQPNRAELSFYDSTHSHRKDAQQTWLMDFLSSNITISGRQRRAIARSDHQSEIQMHGDAHSHRKSIRRDNVSENGVRSTHLEN
jgi:hypothetical protein